MTAMENLSNEKFCVICKELATGRFELIARDTRVNLDSHARICDHCYDQFISSSNSETPTFKAAKFRGWVRGWKKDKFRQI